MIDKTGTITKVAQRTQIQIDVSPEVRQQIKVIAVSNAMSLRELVLTSVANQYPEVKKAVAAELKKG